MTVLAFTELKRNKNTVKHVYKDHSREPGIVPFIYRFKLNELLICDIEVPFKAGLTTQSSRIALVMVSLINTHTRVTFFSGSGEENRKAHCYERDSYSQLW